MKPYNANFLGFVFQSDGADYKYLAPLDYTHYIDRPVQVPCCPLCGDTHYVQTGRFQIDELIDQWVKRYKFNPIADVYRHKILEKRRCRECGLSYYNYHLPDAEELYRRLSATGQYYPSFRSEYGIVTEIIEEMCPSSLLEIGCGTGEFLKRIQHIVPFCMGSEYNSDAARVCSEYGLNVACEDIGQITTCFDIVCHFEVLEHVSNPKEFIGATLRLLPIGGKLIIGTPDPDGILSVNGKGILNLPPHHQFEFSKQTFDWLAKKYGLKIVDYKKTELTYRHYAAYVHNVTGMALTEPDMVGFYEAQKKYTGHSHVVVFEKL